MEHLCRCSNHDHKSRPTGKYQPFLGDIRGLSTRVCKIKEPDTSAIITYQDGETTKTLDGEQMAPSGQSWGQCESAAEVGS